MMDLNEILRGIGDQMSKATPAWSSTPSFGSSQQQASAPSLGGPFANYASQMSTPFPQTPQTYTPFPQQPQTYTPFPDFGQAPGNQQTPFPNFGSIGGQGGTQGPVSGAGTASQDPNEVEQYIRQAAASRHIDPDVAVNKVWANEGKGSYVGDNGSSFGPMQLHYGNVAGGGNATGGLGDAFTKATGMDARDPSTWKAQIDWSLNYASQNGWGPWHGHQGDPHEGIGTYNVPSQAVPGQKAQDGLVGLLQQGGHKLGESYDWGGSGQNGRGFDCSGLVSWVGQQLGVQGIGPRETTFTLFPKTAAISQQDAQPGDLVFYNMDSNRADMQHVAIYMGGGKILQSGGTQHAVNIGEANQSVGSAPIFRRYAPFTQAVSGMGG